MELIDFTDIARKQLSYRAYGGANGIKKGILFRNEPYMLKIEHRDRKKNKYTNSIISEYIASKIFSMFLPTQEVVLGKIYDNNKLKLCVACKDFKKDGEYLYEFINIKNSVLSDDSSNGSDTELHEVLDAIEKQEFCNAIDVRNRFWDMFVIDTLLGNFDRHNGNWGFIVNEKTGHKYLAPVYDCGSCLYPSATDNDIKFFLLDEDEMLKRIFVFPNSALKYDGAKINYYNFLMETNDLYCLDAVLRIVPLVGEKMDDIQSFISGLDILCTDRREFYCKILKMRKEKILDLAFERAKKICIDKLDSF